MIDAIQKRVRTQIKTDWIANVVIVTLFNLICIPLLLIICLYTVLDIIHDGLDFIKRRIL